MPPHSASIGDVTALATLLSAATEKAGTGDREGARTAYREAVRIAPDRAELWHNLGALCAALDDHHEALAAFAEAARRKGDWAEPWNARGHLLFAAGDFAGAGAAFEAALERDPTHVAAHVNAALAQNRLQHWSAAVPHLERARVLSPGDEAIWWILRGNLLRLRRDEDALADFLRFEALAAPSARVAVAALASARRLADPVREARALETVLAQHFIPGESPLVAEVLALVQYFDVPREALHDLYLRYDRLVRAELGAVGEAAHLAPQTPRARDTGRSIRVGYLSADFRAHVMGEILQPVLAAHDATQFEIHLYSLAPAANADATTQRFRAHAAGFTELADVDDAMAARVIAADDLDLLIDLMGHSAFARPGVLARKPARVVATHLGYHGAVGLQAVDYKLTDAVADVPDAARFQIEAPLPLSVCVLPQKRYRAPVARWTRDELGIAADAIVCAAFVPALKLSPRCLALWGAILSAVPSAVLLFSPPRDDDRTALLRRVQGFGIASSRICVVPYAAATLHDRHALADFALDTMPYTGGDTTTAALSAGLPVVTRIGLRHAERMTASILRYAGLAELVADSDDAYVALAVRLATDDAYRNAQRSAVRTALSSASLSNPAIYARALETACLRALSEKKRLPR